MQAEKIRADVADNMLERFKSQTITRPLMRFAVQLLVSRLGLHFHTASNRASVSAIIETVVVERKIRGINSRELRKQSLSSFQSCRGRSKRTWGPCPKM